MLQSIRSNLQGTIAKVIIGIICIPFVLFGVESLVSGGGSNEVAEINGESIAAQELSEAIFLQKKQLMAQMGQNINPAMLEDERLKEPALQALIDTKILQQAANDLGMLVSIQQVNQLIVNNPQFQQEGKFSNALFQQALAGAGFNAEMYTRLTGSTMLISQFSNGIVNSGFMTSDEAVLNARFTQQTRDIRFITLSAEAAAKKVTVSDEEIKDFYEQNESLYQSKEQVSLQYLEIKRASFVTEVSDEEVQQAFDHEVENAVGNDKKEVAHILIEVNDQRDEAEATVLAQELKAKLDGGADFAELARQSSDDFGSREDGGKLGVLNSAAFPDAFVAAAQTLDVDQVSAVVKTEAGLHLITVTSITKDDAPVFSEREQALRAELALAKAEPLFWQAVDELKDLSFNAGDLNEPAQEMELKLQSSGLMSRSGGEGIFAHPQLIAAAFSQTVLSDQQNSDVIELAQDHVVVVRINEHKPAALLPLEVVTADVKQAVVTDKADVLLKDSVSSLLTQLQQGADVEKLAKAQGLDWQLLLATQRMANAAPADRQVINAGFGLPVAAEGQRAIDSLKLSSGDYAVIAVDDVTDGDIASLPPQQQQGMNSYLARARSTEAFQTLQSQLKLAADIEIQ